MITRKELVESKEFWMAKIQSALFEQVEQYLKVNKMSKTDFAKKLGVSKGYVSQILNGDFDHKISKFIELSLAIGYAPILKMELLENCHFFDAIGKLEHLEKGSADYSFRTLYLDSIKFDFNEPRKINSIRNIPEPVTSIYKTKENYYNFQPYQAYA